MQITCPWILIWTYPKQFAEKNSKWTHTQQNTPEHYTTEQYEVCVCESQSSTLSYCCVYGICKCVYLLPSIFAGYHLWMSRKSWCSWCNQHCIYLEGGSPLVTFQMKWLFRFQTIPLYGRILAEAAWLSPQSMSLASRARDLCSYAFPRVSLSLSLTHTHTHKTYNTHTQCCSALLSHWSET